jgi:hypothetical protein
VRGRRLRLVVVVVADEVLDRVVGEEALELAVELGGQRLVGGEDQGGALGGLDHLGDGEGLARAGDAEEDLVALVRLHARDQFRYRLGLVAGGLVVADQAEGAAALGLGRLLGAVGGPGDGVGGAVVVDEGGHRLTDGGRRRGGAAGTRHEREGSRKGRGRLASGRRLS